MNSTMPHTLHSTVPTSNAPTTSSDRHVPMVCRKTSPRTSMLDRSSPVHRLAATLRHALCSDLLSSLLVPLVPTQASTAAAPTYAPKTTLDDANSAHPCTAASKYRAKCSQYSILKCTQTHTHRLSKSSLFRNSLHVVPESSYRRGLQRLAFSPGWANGPSVQSWLLPLIHRLI